MLNPVKQGTITPQNFCYWLQGIFEVTDPQGLSKTQLDVVKEHLGLVFKKVTVKTILTELDKPNKNDDILPSKAWEDYLKQIEQIPHCSTGEQIKFPFLVEYGPQGSC